VSTVTTGISLRVTEAATKDVGRALARMDPSTLAALGVTPGDIVEIRGESAAVAKAMPLPASQRGDGRVALDGVTRENAKAAIDTTVTVVPVASLPAEAADLVPLGFEPAPRDLDYIGRLLDGLAVREGTRIRATLFGSRSAEFRVARTTPAGVVVFHPLTRLTIRPRGEDGASPARLTYEDVGGLRPQLQRIREMIELPLRRPELFERLGIDPPKGLLLYGPPGTGKTLIARAIASEASARFFTISGPEIIHKFYGESEAHLRKVFEDASRHAPSIVFLDEIDAIAPRRERTLGDVEKRVVAQLLALMDGLERRGRVIVLAATNLPDALDPALRRPGRFDREIAIPAPDRVGRREILEIHSHGMPLAPAVSLDHLAARTHGFVGADLEALCREAAMRCLRRLLPELDTNGADLSRLEVSPDDFESALVEVEPSALRDVLAETPSVRWSEVGGMDEVRDRLIEAIQWPIERPDLFEQAGLAPPKGILLAGPPGCGKTLIAKAAATETGVNFISIAGPALLSKYVGESERSVRDLFRKARLAAPCILFFDEIDALAPKRGGGEDPVAERLLIQLLTELDGIEELRGVLVLAATNRPDRLDPALLRPGRFDLRIDVPLPGPAARAEILRVHLAGKPGVTAGMEEIARSADGWSGADLMAAAETAAMRAVRRAWRGEPLHIERQDLEELILGREQGVTA
jgi:transitional endoplasmic reticulum ATPase